MRKWAHIALINIGRVLVLFIVANVFAALFLLGLHYTAEPLALSPDHIINAELLCAAFSIYIGVKSPEPKPYM